MVAVATRRLPGVHFQVVQPPPADVLPRMDIAGFVGFAAQGPLHTPVPVEDVARFRDVFGADLPLAWDVEQGREQIAYLGAAVEAFFRNGGRRCWVVRVARDATTNTFPLAGLIDAAEGRPALARARCPGSWSDKLRVGTVLNREVLGTAQRTGKLIGEGPQLRFRPASSFPPPLPTDDEPRDAYEVALTATIDQVQPGDLLRLTYEEGSELYLTVKDRRLSQATALLVTGVGGRWFRRRVADEASPPETSITLSVREAVLVSGEGEASDVTLYDDAVPGAPLPPRLIQRAAGDGTGRYHYEVVFEIRPAVVSQPGQVLRLTVDSGSPPEGQTVWLPVSRVEDLPDDASVPADSPPALGLRLEADEGLWPLNLHNDSDAQDALITQLQDVPFTVERLTMALLWRRQAEQGPRQRQAAVGRLDALGFSGELDLKTPETVDADEEPAFDDPATRFWARLPLDYTLFHLKEGMPKAPPALGTLAREVFEPRFPLAGPRRPARLYLPLGMSMQPDDALTQGRLAQSDEIESLTVLERDGLDAFDAALFLDELMVESVQLTALQRLIQNRLLRLDEDPPQGLHSLLSIDEVTLLAVPDAVHRGWVRETPEALDGLEAPDWTPASPEFLDDPAPCLPGSYRLCWSSVSALPPEPELMYEVEEALEPAFDQPALRYRGAETCTPVYFEERCPQRLYYRVRAVQGVRQSPWSVTLTLHAPEVDFEACTRPLGGPVLSLETSGSPPESILDWLAIDGATSYTLEVAADPAFLTARAIKRAQPDEAFYLLDPLPGGATYFRVRAERADTEVGPWSNTVVFKPKPRHAWVMKTVEAFDAPRADTDTPTPAEELLAVQRAMLRFCTARGDMVALLSLPRHYREEQTLAHVARLTPDLADDEDFPGLGLSTLQTHPIPLLNQDEGQVLSYGALYHPWTAVRAEGGRNTNVLFFPPDGAICGMAAARAITRGAWIAPANVPLTDVLALEPRIDRDGWQHLFNRNVNVVRPDPRGFLPMGADTLSQSIEVRPLNVRRLMILLRRLILRAGNTFVFESNTADLRRRIRFRFEELLTDLFQRGALAGRTPAEAFRVETGVSVNPPESVDLGRLIVVLKVAPARPLSFITVRLVQHDTAGFRIEEG